MRRDSCVVVEDASETENSSLHRDRDSLSPLNLSVSQCGQAETASYKMRETQSEKMSRRKKMRNTFTGRQIFELEKMFEVKKYLNASERNNLSR